MPLGFHSLSKFRATVSDEQKDDTLPPSMPASQICSARSQTGPTVLPVGCQGKSAVEKKKKDYELWKITRKGEWQYSGRKSVNCVATHPGDCLKFQPTKRKCNEENI